MNRVMIRLLFVVSGLYDLAIGIALLGFGPAVFTRANVPHPNHWGYIQFGCLMLITFGLMFFAVAANPQANRNLIPFGVLLKLSYCGIVGFYWTTTDLPLFFKPFAVIDAVMLVLFLLSYRTLRRQPA